MIWVQIASILVTIVGFVFVMRELRDLNDKVRMNNRLVNQLLRQVSPSQGNVKAHRVHQRIPKVDAIGKTSVRDTDDIPVRGARIGRIKRVVRDGTRRETPESEASST